MTNIVQESVRMLEMLPKSEQEFASQFIKRLVLAWDSYFTKLTDALNVSPPYMIIALTSVSVLPAAYRVRSQKSPRLFQ